MIMIQDDPMPTGSDKPLRITGDPYKVQVCVDQRCSVRSAGRWCHVTSDSECVCVQQARELVAEIIREKDQGDFRSGRSDFGSRLGSSIDVRLRSAPARFRDGPRVLIVGLLSQVAVPRFAVGIVIGRNGEMIKKIQNDAGVRIQFKPGQFT